MQNQFSIQQSLAFSWQAIKQYPFLFVTLSILAAVFDLGSRSGALLFPGHTKIVWGLLLCAGLIAGLVVRLGLIRAALCVVDGKTPSLKQSFAEIERVVSFCVVVVLYASAIGIGLLLFGVPGIIAAIFFGFAPFIVLDKHEGIIRSFRESVRLTRGHRMELGFLLFALLAINLFGLLLLIVGVLVTIPLSVIAYAYAYRALSGDLPASHSTVKSSAPVVPKTPIFTMPSTPARPASTKPLPSMPAQPLASSKPVMPPALSTPPAQPAPAVLQSKPVTPPAPPKPLTPPAPPTPQKPFIPPMPQMPPKPLTPQAPSVPPPPKPVFPPAPDKPIMPPVSPASNPVMQPVPIKPATPPAPTPAPTKPSTPPQRPSGSFI